jgi:hypothetical protein
MKPAHFINVVRLIIGLCFGLYGVVCGGVQYFHGQPAKALATAVIWTLAGCIVAPLAEDVEDMIRDMIKRKKENRN